MALHRESLVPEPSQTGIVLDGGDNEFSNRVEVLYPQGMGSIAIGANSVYKCLDTRGNGLYLNAVAKMKADEEAQDVTDSTL